MPKHEFTRRLINACNREDSAVLKELLTGVSGEYLLMVAIEWHLDLKWIYDVRMQDDQK